MKPQNIFVGMAPKEDILIRCVQAVCKERCVQELMEIGSWDFKLLRNASTQWYCAYIHGEFEVTQEILLAPQLQELKGRLEEAVDKERFSPEEQREFNGKETGDEVSGESTGLPEDA